MQIARTLEHYWMPFTDNARFKAAPKLIMSAKDMYYTTSEGRQAIRRRRVGRGGGVTRASDAVRGAPVAIMRGGVSIRGARVAVGGPFLQGRTIAGRDGTGHEQGYHRKRPNEPFRRRHYANHVPRGPRWQSHGKGRRYRSRCLNFRRPGP